MDIRGILTSAIEKERDAVAFYSETARAHQSPGVAGLLAELANQEREHAGALASLDAADVSFFRPEARLDLKLAEYLRPTTIGPDATLRQTLTYAMQREHDAWRLYMDMAGSVRERETRALFQKLAVMENTHKAKIEELFESLFLAQR